MKKQFAEYKGRFYVMIRSSGIHWLIPYIDGMAISMFRKCKKPYIRLDDAIEWHEKELEKTHGASGSRKVLDLLKQSRQRLTTNRESENNVFPIKNTGAP